MPPISSRHFAGSSPYLAKVGAIRRNSDRTSDVIQEPIWPPQSPTGIWMVAAALRAAGSGPGELRSLRELDACWG